jgi:hypothetical protein
MLRPLDPRCEVVQFGHALSDGDFRTLSDWLRGYPTVTLRAYGDGAGADLDFLRFFPTLRAFQADFSYHIGVGLDGLIHLPADLTYLGLGQTKCQRTRENPGRRTVGSGPADMIAPGRWSRDLQDTPNHRQ